MSKVVGNLNVIGDLTVTGSSPGGAEFTQTSVKSAAYTAVAGDEVLCDTNAAVGSFDITLPATPNAGDQVRIVLITDHATRNVQIDRNGSNWMGSTTANVEDKYMLCIEGDSVTVKYMGGGVGWSVIDDSIQTHVVSLTNSTTQTPGSGWAWITFDTETKDVGGIGDLTNNEIVVRRPGDYVFHASIRSDTVIATGNYVHLGITSEVSDTTWRILGGGPTTISSSDAIVGVELSGTIYDLAAGDRSKLSLDIPPSEAIKGTNTNLRFQAMEIR